MKARLVTALLCAAAGGFGSGAVISLVKGTRILKPLAGAILAGLAGGVAATLFVVIVLLVVFLLRRAWLQDHTRARLGIVAGVVGICVPLMLELLEAVD